MPPSLPVILIRLALAAIIALAYHIEARHPQPRQPTDALAYCAWCVHRDGDTCTHPDSPVCIGKSPCTVRHAEPWGYHP